MAAAVIPLVELGLTELPTLITIGTAIVTDLKKIFHKAPGTIFTPEQVAKAQAMSLAAMKVEVKAALPQSAATVTDAQLQAFIEMIYQVVKKLTPEPPAAPPVPEVVVPVMTASGIESLVALLIPLVTPLLTKLLMGLAAPTQQTPTTA